MNTLTANKAERQTVTDYIQLSKTYSTVKPRYLAPRYLAKLVSRHMNAQDGFPAMYFTSISHHPCLFPLPRPTLVLPHVI